MALFGKKNDRVLDLAEKYRAKLDAETQSEPAVENVASETGNSGMNFLGSMASGIQSAEPTEDISGTVSEVDEPVVGESVETRKRKLAKKFSDMTSQIETLSNQIYHLQQRIDVLERKAGMGRD
jgi:hypothetical protein